MKKFIKIKFILAFLFVSFNAQALTILLDPGHGGDELGAVTEVNENGRVKKIYEKDLSLELAQLIKKKIGSAHNIYLTRSVDRTVTLEERAELAEKLKVDLFISIHFNSSKNHKHHGFETYYLDNHNNAAIRKLEASENTDMKGVEKTVNQILIDLVVDKTVDSSKKLSTLIHKKIQNTLPDRFQMKDRGLKPGLFYVLALSKRPGVLLEAGFLSNPKEAQKINRKSFMDEYANSVASGIREYISFNHKVASVPLF
ncbi:MAG: N-acetylmuramoyl-L-alanine amidase [Bacteriovoracaceae bacterium]|nr:N-acetylmuramoyl-L-alanine amidase [Bacteriovoracaceae bacterium]